MIPPKTLRTALGETRASYPVPFLAGTGCGTALVILMLACSLGGARFWVLFVVACGLLACVAALIAFTVARRLDLLRDERTIIMQGAIRIFGDDEIGDLAKDHVGRAVETYLTHPGPARPDMLPGKNSRSHGEDDGDDDA